MDPIHMYFTVFKRLDESVLNPGFAIYDTIT